MPELSLFHGRVSWASDGGQWRFAVEARNLADKKYVAGSAVRSNPISPEVRLSAGDRRTIIGRVEYTF